MKIVMYTITITTETSRDGMVPTRTTTNTIKVSAIIMDGTIRNLVPTKRSINVDPVKVPNICLDRAPRDFVRLVASVAMMLGIKVVRIFKYDYMEIPDTVM